MTKADNTLFEIKAGNTLLLGVTKVANGVQFAVALPDVDSCTLHIYKKGSTRRAASIILTEEFKIGGAFFVVLTGMKKGNDRRGIAEILQDDYEYTYEADGKEFVDPYTYQIQGRNMWGKALSVDEKKLVRGGFSLEGFEWEADTPLRIPLHEMILYQIHVRGFTKHTSSKVKKKGTYAGVTEKIPYLRELGINGVMLLPCYEFDEVIYLNRYGDTFLTEEEKKNPHVKLNYWGYGTNDTYYFAPKASYAAEKNHVNREFKEMVKSLHAAGIEVLMDIYFEPGTNLFLMAECLRHWVLHYHVDGFRVNQEVMPSYAIASDPILCNVKLLTAYWDKDMLAQNRLLGKRAHLAEYNDGFMNDARRYLKSDEARVESFVYRMKRNPQQCGVINYISHVNGFTMMDMVSYDVKHNESNGEHNTDGTDYNYSWNCGFEGKTRRKAIMQKRKLQIRNAFFMLLASQGTPMILAGDEFGNSQQGNNNPYCQDNAITWLNWNQTEQNSDILAYVRELIRFRKAHPILHMEEEMKMMDSLSCGYPDLSIHGTRAWYEDFSPYNRMLGVLLCGKYTHLPDGTEDKDIFIAYNMHWEPQSFDLPNISDGRQWNLYLDTYENAFYEIVPRPKPKKKKGKSVSLEQQKKTIVPPRSIVVYISD